jgi:protein-S-isoprenylcysteine O-methyltransferase Ste14
MAEVSEGIIAGQPSAVILLRDEIPPPRAGLNLQRLATAAGNIGLAGLFFSTLFFGAFVHINSLSDLIWISGAALMGVFALVRVAPKTVLISFGTLAATAGMMLIPLLLKSQPSPHRWLSRSGETIELAGIIISQVSRVYLGRSFGLLPANRGIVSGGPFRLVRHPVYLGWLLLTIGYVMVNPVSRNLLVTVAILPFMFARITQEEMLLQADPEYRAYSERTHYRILPGLY